MTLKKSVDGVVTDMTSEEEAAFIASLPAPTTPVQAPVSLCQVAGARLTVDQDAWDVTGVERSTGISGAFLADVDTVFVFFNEPQPDDAYEVIPATGVTKYPEYVEVARPGLTDLVFIVQRVQ